ATGLSPAHLLTCLSRAPSPRAFADVLERPNQRTGTPGQAHPRYDVRVCGPGRALTGFPRSGGAHQADLARAGPLSANSLWAGRAKIYPAEVSFHGGERGSTEGAVGTVQR